MQKIIYEIHTTKDVHERTMYWVDYFVKSERGISPDIQSASMTLKELLEFLKDAIVA